MLNDICGLCGYRGIGDARCVGCTLRSGYSSLLEAGVTLKSERRKAGLPDARRHSLNTFSASQRSSTALSSKISKSTTGRVASSSLMSSEDTPGIASTCHRYRPDESDAVSELHSALSSAFQASTSFMAG